MPRILRFFIRDSTETHRKKAIGFSFRSKWSRRAFIFSLLFVSLNGHITANGQPKKSPFQKVLSERESIRYGSMSATLTYDVVTDIMPTYKGVSRKYKIWFDVEAENWRIDTLWVHPRNQRLSQTLANDDGSFHDDGPGTLHANHSHIKSVGPSMPDILDIRFVGLTTKTTHLQLQRTDEPKARWLYFDLIDRPHNTVSRNKLYQESPVLSADVKPDTILYLFSDTGTPNRPSRAVLQNSKGRKVTTIEYFREPIGYATTGPNKLMDFPKKVTSQLYRSDKLAYQETLVIEKVDFENRPDPLFFDFVSLKIAEGRRVISDDSLSFRVKAGGSWK